MRRLVLGAVAACTALGILQLTTGPADAKFSGTDPNTVQGKAAIKCYRAILKGEAKYQAKLLKTIDKCKKDVVKKGTASQFGSLAGCSPLPAALQTKADTARAKMIASIERACGGGNKVCNAADTGTDADVPVADVNWDAGCATIRDSSSGQGSGSTFSSMCDVAVPTVADCRDIGACLACQTEFAVAFAMDDFLADPFDSTIFGASSGADKTNNKCQQTILKVGGKFLTAKRKTVGKCWDKKVKRKSNGFDDNDQCPDTDPKLGRTGAPKTVEKIRKLEQKFAKAVCKKCGGGGDADKDGVCDNPTAPLDFLGGPFACVPADVPPSAVDPHRYPNACSAIGSGPSNTVVDLQEYIDCMNCLLEYLGDCLAFTSNGDGDQTLGLRYPSDCGVFAGP